MTVDRLLILAGAVVLVAGLTAADPVPPRPPLPAPLTAGQAWT
jgi:hypothetical protein